MIKKTPTSTVLIKLISWLILQSNKWSYSVANCSQMVMLTLSLFAVAVWIMDYAYSFLCSSNSQKPIIWTIGWIIPRNYRMHFCLLVRLLLKASLFTTATVPSLHTIDWLPIFLHLKPRLSHFSFNWIILFLHRLAVIFIRLVCWETSAR